MYLHACCTRVLYVRTHKLVTVGQTTTAARNTGINNYRCITGRDAMQIMRFRVAVDDVAHDHGVPEQRSPALTRN